jgi:ABC-type Fe3+/spermidine/putrescine transport system ATPase subunit
VIVTRTLIKRYGAVTAVRSVDLDVREGDRYGLLGPNGSGKTTLVRMLLGLVYATSGEIEVLGRRMPRHAREVLPQIGALVEEPAAYPHLSGRANLTLLDAAGPRSRAAAAGPLRRRRCAQHQAGRRRAAGQLDIQRGFGIQAVYVMVFLAAAWANFSTKDITA